MKNLIVIALLLTGFISCKKDNTPSVNNTVNVRYEFSADLLGEYDFKYLADTIILYETTNTQNWIKTVTYTKRAGLDSASATVYPPVAWTGTNIVSNVSLKVFVNGVEKASNTAVLGGVDRPTGITTSVTFQ